MNWFSPLLKIYDVFKKFISVEKEMIPNIEVNESSNGFKIIMLTFNGAQHGSYVIQNIYSKNELFEVMSVTREYIFELIENTDKPFCFKETHIYNKRETILFSVASSQERTKITIKYSFLRSYSFFV